MTVLCCGDSNTFGYDPRGYFGGRYDAPWPKLLGELTGFEVHNNGMSGRTIPGRGVAFPKNADMIVLMLGTNDLLQGASAAEAAVRMKTFLATLTDRNVLLIAPPPIVRGEWVTDETLCAASRELARLYGQLGVPFLDAGQWDIPMAYDGVHFTEEGHRRFAEQLAKEIIRKGG